jgi:hypothetical protein
MEVGSMSPQAARVKALRSAPLDSWIALSDDETKLVATGHTYQEVASELDRVGDDSAVILKTPLCWRPLSV